MHASGKLKFLLLGVLIPVRVVYGRWVFSRDARLKPTLGRSNITGCQIITEGGDNSKDINSNLDEQRQ